MARPLLVIAGLGQGLGVALAGIFAEAGYDIAGLSRSGSAAAEADARARAGGGTFTHLLCDLTVHAEVTAALEPVRKRVDVLIHAAHALLIRPFAETEPDEFEEVWRSGVLSAVTVARSIVPEMQARGHGVIIFSGATASVRGGAKFAAFASAKFALRGMAQAMARELGPHGVHVAHVILDGLIDEPQTERRFGLATSTRMDPMAIAAAYLALVRQPPSAWTHEIDLRPGSERF